MKLNLKYFAIFFSLLFSLNQLQAQKAQSEAAKEKARIKAKYAPFSTCPIKELKKDTLTMDSILQWKSFYDTLGVKIDLAKLQGYTPPDSTHKTLILITNQMKSPEGVYPFYEKVMNVNKKKIFSKKEMKVKDSDIQKSQRSLSDAPGLYMIWIEGEPEPEAATIGEMPDSSKTNITLNEMLVWQLYNYWTRGSFADNTTATICSDVCTFGKKDDPSIAIVSFVGGVPKAYILDPALASGNLSGCGPRSVKVVPVKAKK